MATFRHSVRTLILSSAAVAGLAACDFSERSSDYRTLDVTVAVTDDVQGRRYAVASADVGRLTEGDRVAIRYANFSQTLYRREADYRYTARLPDTEDPVESVHFDVTRGNGGDTVTLSVSVPRIEDFSVTRLEPGIDASNPVTLSWRLVPNDERFETLIEARPLRCEDANGAALSTESSSASSLLSCRRIYLPHHHRAVRCVATRWVSLSGPMRQSAADRSTMAMERPSTASTFRVAFRHSSSTR